MSIGNSHRQLCLYLVLCSELDMTSDPCCHMITATSGTATIESNLVGSGLNGSAGRALKKNRMCHTRAIL